MNTGNVLQYLDSLLPNEKVIQDMVNYTWGNENHEVAVEVEDEVKIILARPLPIEVVTKAFYQEYFEIGFGTGYRVLAALGGIKEIKFGVVYPTYCFMTLYYNSDLIPLTADYHRRM
jgi:hypothetical protein